MRILVLGRSGQVAQSLAERARIFPEIDLFTAGRERIDLADRSTIASGIAAARPDIVINAAAFTAVDAAEEDEGGAMAVNAVGAGEAARGAADIGARFIHLSTDYVFDGSGTHARGEDAPTAPLGAYGRSKLAGEEAVKAAAPASLIVRTAWVYSPFGHNFVKTMINAARGRDTLRVVDDQRGNPTNALDLADALLIACIKGWEAGGILHVAGSGETSWAGFAQAIMDECRSLGAPTATIERITTADWPTPATRPANSSLDSRKFTSEFGFKMPEWTTSLPDVVARIAVPGTRP